MEEKSLTKTTILCYGDGLWNEQTHKDLILMLLNISLKVLLLLMLIKIHITKVIMFSQLVLRNKQRKNDKGVKENECQRSERDAHVQVLSTILLACSSRCRSRLLLMFYNCMTYAQMLLSRRNQAHYNQPDNGPFIPFWKINDSLK